MIKFIINIVLFMILLSNTLIGAEVPVTFADARVTGMGNTFVAIADDKNMLFFNPAGFATFGLMETSKIDAIFNPTMWKPSYSNIGDITLASGTLGFSGLGMNDLLIFTGIEDGEYSDPWMKLQDMGFFEKFNDGTLTTADMAKANTELIKAYSTSLHLTANVEVLSIARHYFGFGIFSTTDAVLKLDPTRGFISFPNIQAKLYSDVIFPVGIGIPIPNHRNWSVGVTFKYFHRLKIELNNLADWIALSQWFGGDNMSDDISDYMDKHSTMDVLLNGVEYTDKPIEQIKMGTGYGFDLGFMYRPSYAWKFGLQLSDVYTKINWWDKSEPSMIPINARVGVAYMPNFNFLYLFEDPIFAIDIEDIFHQQEKNFFLKWHFGTEVKFLLSFFRLRFGINDGYPSYGAGIDLGLHFISKIPILKWLRPNRIYFPKFNPKDKEFLE